MITRSRKRNAVSGPIDEPIKKKRTTSRAKRDQSNHAIYRKRAERLVFDKQLSPGEVGWRWSPAANNPGFWQVTVQRAYDQFRANAGPYLAKTCWRTWDVLERDTPLPPELGLLVLSYMSLGCSLTSQDLLRFKATKSLQQFLLSEHSSLVATVQEHGPTWDGDEYRAMWSDVKLLASDEGPLLYASHPDGLRSCAYPRLLLWLDQVDTTNLATLEAILYAKCTHRDDDNLGLEHNRGGWLCQVEKQVRAWQCLVDAASADTAVQK